MLKEVSGTLYIVFLTGVCNLKCKYCGGTMPEHMMPHEVKYSIEMLRDFISQDDRPSIAFYGGEPLLRMDLMKRIMDTVDAEHYILQTNGLLLNELEEDYLKMFSTILVSIDGRKVVTDYYKGEGVYDRVVRNVRIIRKVYENELIARMVATQRTDIYEDVLHLLNLGLFTHIHWQLDVIWSAEGIWVDFESWLRRYDEGISKLVRLWVDDMERGKVLGIVPFLGVLKALLGYENTSPPCGAGINSFAITTDGRVLACPICPDLEWNVLGTLRDDPNELPKVDLLEPCRSCDLRFVCGGRCLFFNRERLWGEEGFKAVCRSVRHLIEEVKRMRERIVGLVKEGRIELKDLIYPKFNNTTEIIP